MSAFRNKPLHESVQVVDTGIAHFNGFADAYFNRHMPGKRDPASLAVCTSASITGKVIPG